jgi:Fic family protein
MEGEIVDKDYVEQIIKNKSLVWESLWELEATNIRNGFIWAYKQSLKWDFVFSSKLVKQAHKITTKGLDSLVEKWLKYNLWEFRDYQVDMGIFQSPNGKSEYYPPKNPEAAMNKLEEYMSNWEFNIIKLAHLHLFLYSLHPFSNGNKRSTRIIESLAIQSRFDKGHYFKGMGYFYKKNMPTYLKKVKGVLSGKIDLKEWVLYYVSSFQTMARFSITDLQMQQQSITWKISPSRIRYYDATDQIIDRFYLKNLDNFFTAKQLNKYLVDYDKVYSDNKQIYKRIQKHMKDNLIYKTEEKEGRDTLYRVQLEQDL